MKKYSKNSVFFNHKSLFLSFCANYILLLILTIGIGSYAYNESLKIVEKNAIETGLTSLNQTKDIMDTRFREIESIVTQLAVDARVLGILNIKRPLSGPDHYKILELSDKIPAYNHTNRFIYDTYLYYDTDIFISSSFSTAEMKEHYNTRFKYENLNYEEWKERIFNSQQSSIYWQANSVRILNNEKKYITYIRPIPLGTYKNYRAVVIMLINENEVLKGWDYLNVSDNSWYYVADKNGNIITSRNYSDFQSENIDNVISNGFIEKEIDGEKMIILSTISAVNGWEYVTAIPSSYLTDKVEYIRKTYMLTLFVALIIGFFLAIVLSYRNSMPIIKIISKIKMRDDNLPPQNASAYNFLEEAILNLFENNNELKNDVQKQIDITKAALFERLIKGGFNRISDIENVQSHIGLSFKENSFIIILIRINSYSDEIIAENLNKIDITRVLISREIEQLIKEENKVYNLDSDKIAVIISFDNSRTDYMDMLKKNLIDLSSRFSSLYNINISVGVGNRYHNLINLRDSYEEASKALDSLSSENENRVSIYSDIYKNTYEYYYPLEIESRLINLIKMGELSESMVLVDLIYKKNSSENPLPINMVNLLVNEMFGTIVKLKKNIVVCDDIVVKLDDLMKKMKEAESLDDIFKSYRETVNFLCLTANSNKKSHNLELKESIIEYIKKEYHNENFCLLNIASKFGRSEKYLTNFLKEQLGESFQSYLERFRMEKAVDLLKRDDLTIAEVSNHTGYTNVNTFYKAFKRFTGVSPSTYRENTRDKASTL